MPDTDLCHLTATELTSRIRDKAVSAREVLEAHLAQIDRINPKINAIVSMVPEQALADADAADEAFARGDQVGVLHGLPVAHKDLVDTKGIPSTQGSPIYTDYIPKEDALIVDRIKQAGAITLGKTNVPEFGAGSQTFNPVFGTTKNPYDQSKTCGGSSGGAGAALACRMLPIADGSDLGGSLRNPGNFNNVVGFRVSPGRVPGYPNSLGWFPLSVQGPMARTVDDTALLLSAIAGFDRRSPISINEPGKRFLESLERDFRGTRIAWTKNLGGLPVDPRVTGALETQRHVFEDLGCIVEDAEPDFSGADETFKVLRAWRFEIAQRDHLLHHRDKVKDTVIWNAEAGQKLTGPDVATAEQTRTEIYHRFRLFLEDYDYFVCPVNQVPPFDVDTPYVTEIDGVRMETYIDWMKSCYYITITCHPAISVPCGFTPEGLPVGVQIVGRYQDDFGVLQMAKAFEGATETWKHLPDVLK